MKNYLVIYVLCCYFFATFSFLHEACSELLAVHSLLQFLLQMTLFTFYFLLMSHSVTIH